MISLNVILQLRSATWIKIFIDSVLYVIQGPIFVFARSKKKQSGNVHKSLLKPKMRHVGVHNENVV